MGDIRLLKTRGFPSTFFSRFGKGVLIHSNGFFKFGGGTPPLHAPVAAFSFVTADLEVTFTDESTDVDGTITDWLWNFGDTNTSILQNPVHTYAADGDYNVSLTVTDNDGLQGSTQQIVSVSSAGPAVPIVFLTMDNMAQLTALGANVLNNGSTSAKTICDFQFIVQDTLPGEFRIWKARRVDHADATDHGFGALGIEYFDTTDGVTPIAPVPLNFHGPAETNLCLDSRTFGGAGWQQFNGITVTQDQVGLDGQANSASLLDDQNGASVSRLQQSIAIADNTLPYVFKCFVKKDTDQTRFPELGFRTLDGTTPGTLLGQLNTQTGAFQIRTNNNANGQMAVVDFGLWWEVFLEMENNGTGNVRISPYFYPAAASTLGGIPSGTVVGSIIAGNAEVFEDRRIGEVIGTNPIYTTTAAVSWDADALRLPNSPNVNWFQDEGITLLRFTPIFDIASTLPTNISGLLTLSSDEFGVITLEEINTLNPVLTSNTLTTAASVQTTWLANQDILVAVVYKQSESSFEIGVSIDGGLWSWASAAYAGNFDIATLITWYLSTEHVIHHQMCKLYHDGLTTMSIADMKTWVEANAATETDI